MRWTFLWLEGRLQCATRSEEMKKRYLANTVTRQLRPVQPSWLIDLIIFSEHPHYHPGSFRDVQEWYSRRIKDGASTWMSWKGVAEVVPRFPAVFVSWMCSLVSWWCNVDLVSEPYKKITTFLCEIIEHRLYFSLHVSSPQGQCVRFLEYSVLSEPRWRKHRLTRFYLLPLLVIYLFVHLQVRPGLFHHVIPNKEFHSDYFVQVQLDSPKQKYVLRGRATTSNRAASSAHSSCFPVHLFMCAPQCTSAEDKTYFFSKFSTCSRSRSLSLPSHSSSLPSSSTPLF